MPHHGDDRRPWNEILFTVGVLAGLLDLLGQVRRDELDFVAELLGHKHERLGIEPLVDGHHQTQIHARLDDLVDRSVVHQGRKVVHGHELCDFQNFLVGYLLCHLLLGLGGGQLPLLFSVLGSEVVLLIVIHPCVGLFDLLLDLLLYRLLLLLGHRRLEAVRSTVPLLSALPLVLGWFGVLVLVLARIVVGLLAFLRHIDLLASLCDPLPLLVAFPRLELGQVNLAQNLKSGSGTGISCFFFLGLRMSVLLWLLIPGFGLLFLSLPGGKLLFMLAQRPLSVTDIFP